VPAGKEENRSHRPTGLVTVRSSAEPSGQRGCARRSGEASSTQGGARNRYQQWMPFVRVSAQRLARHAGWAVRGHRLWRIFCQYLLVILILSYKGRAGLANHELPEPSVGVNWVRVTASSDPRDTSLTTLAVLTEEMRWRLYSFVRAAHRPVSREEAAASTGISRKLAAFHLDKLVGA